MPQRPHLPVDDLLPGLCASLENVPSAVVVAPPGTGKTTRIPPALMACRFLGAAHRNVLLLQPRRIAARAAAARIADENRWTLGGDMVGYQIRFEKRLTHATRIRVLTEGILTRQMIADASLPGCGCVILDEFHERGIHTDLAIAMLREVQQALRPDLRIVVMSATMDPDPVARFLGGAPVFRCGERLHAVEVEYLPRHDAAPRWELAARAVRAELNPARGAGGHVLVFLPGIREIRRTEALLSGLDADTHILHSSVPPAAQARALAPSARRKVILATNIAETSLTIDGVSSVVDTGLVRVQMHDARLGIDRMETVRVCSASAEQRAGRAGRTGPGRCVRLWTREEQGALAPAQPAEIHRIDLSTALLSLLAYGVGDPCRFAWFDAPAAERLQSAARLLHMLGATDNRGRITPKGRRLASLPLHPRLGCLLLAGAEYGVAGAGAAIAAYLSERDLFERGQSARGPARTEHRSDMLVRLEQCLGPRQDGQDHFARQRFGRLREDLERLASPTARGHHRDSRPNLDDEVRLCKLLLHGYPDRVTLRRPGDAGRGVMVGGRGVALEPECGVRRGELFLSLDVREPERNPGADSRVAIASWIDADWLAEIHPALVRREVVHRYVPERNRTMSFELVLFADLAIRETGLGACTDPQERATALMAHLGQAPAAVFGRCEEAALWLQRAAFLRGHMPGLELPAFDAEMLGEALRQACLHAGSDGCPGPAALVAALEAQLTARQRAAIDTHAPTTLRMPSGSRIRVRYDDHGNASVAVRLHELFGQAETPRIADGRVAVRMQLLGPNHVPVQVTTDLRSFWNNTYPAVRRELRARYPRLKWPENPWEAEPIKTTRVPRKAPR